jgi:hypothetical protein
MWWGRDAAAWTALAAWATVIVYIGLFFYARRQVGEARRLREEQARPFVVADFEVGPPIILTVENLGRTLARDVTIRFDERIETTGLLETNKPYDVNEVRLLRESLPVLPPGKKIRVLFDSQKRFTSDLPLAFGVTVSYRGPLGQKYPTDRYTLDLGMYAETLFPPKGLPQLVQEVAKVREELGRWRSGIRGLLVQTVDKRKQDRRELRALYLYLLRDRGPKVLARQMWVHALQRFGVR